MRIPELSDKYFKTNLEEAADQQAANIENDLEELTPDDSDADICLLYTSRFLCRWDIHRLLQDSLCGKRRAELHSRIFFHLPHSSNDDSHLLSV